MGSARDVLLTGASKDFKEPAVIYTCACDPEAAGFCPHSAGPRHLWDRPWDGTIGPWDGSKGINITRVESSKTRPHNLNIGIAL